MKAKLTEKDFQAQVVRLARTHHWLVYHTHDSRKSAAGFPDLVLCHPRRGVVLFAELKVGGNRPTAEQAEWLSALGAAGDARLWRPEDWPEIERALSGEDFHG